MKSSIDISLADFIYAVGVSAAFQRIDTPIVSLDNLLILIAFVTIIDDWVLYHIQAGQVTGASRGAFAKSMVLDASVLLLWYCAAVTGAHGDVREFHIYLGLFYCATFAWEWVFAKTVGSARMIPDLVCACVFLLGAVLCDRAWYPYAAVLIALVWLAARRYAWARIVFNADPTHAPG